MENGFSVESALQHLEDLGAYLKGHFLLTTGRHSDQFFLLARLTERPAVLDVWARELAGRLEPYEARTVVGPAVGGIIPAYAVGRHWPTARVLFAEKGDGAEMVFKRGFCFSPGESCVVVEDAVTTGSSVAKVIHAVEAAGGVVKAVGAMVDRRSGPLAFDKPLEALVRISGIPNWDPQECPLCAKGVPLQRPKS